MPRGSKSRRMEASQAIFVPMHSSRGNAQLLALLTAAIAACGTDITTTSNLPDAATADAASSADAGTDATPEAAAPSDAGGDACPPGTQPDGDGGCLSLTVRRPFLIGSSLRLADAASRTDWVAVAPPCDLSCATTRAWLAEAWLRDGLEEHASVAAFARFTMMLLAVGAPPELVVASQRASLDEVRHAKDCFALAARYGGGSRGPAPLSIDGAIERTPSLVDLVELTAEEGCVGETLGAALAAEQADRATDPHAREVLASLARDEARHAELAWRVVAWAIARGGEPVREAAARAIHRAITATRANPVREYPGVDMSSWRAHGRLACGEARAASEAAIVEVVLPSLSALGAGPAVAPQASRAEA